MGRASGSAGQSSAISGRLSGKTGCRISCLWKDDEEFVIPGQAGIKRLSIKLLEDQTEMVIWYFLRSSYKRERDMPDISQAFFKLSPEMDWRC